ncbi:MAG: extracellular solute-binding protein [Bacilli bacterium]|nr:extracellular solute-binding protein [Bacilli bacterium]MDY0208694.1 extracellular solute-binding protein [Bacilli bacterium]
MKKTMISLFAMVVGVFLLTNVTTSAAEETLTLRVYNWYEYIEDGKDEDGNKIGASVMEEWAADYLERTGKTVTVVYDMFETNELMLNTLKTGKTTYDLVCPSDYIIQKMIREDMLEKIDLNKMPNYQEYASPYLKTLFTENGWEDYAVGYMWGTMGFIYNPEKVSEEDINSWSILWNEAYKNRATAKNSVRDTYIIGVFYVYKEELDQLASDFAEGKIDAHTYQRQVTTIMNRTDAETLVKVEEALNLMKENIYGFEVDSGKKDIVTGKIDINFAWSGDAVYAMDTAEEENDMELNYIVPLEGSNVWFDGWVMPKGANVELASDFVNYLSSPEVAVKNMNKIGYTSAIAGDAIFDQIIDWYGDEEGVDVDLTYFFQGTLSEDKLTDGKAIVKINERGRQFDAQYPDEEIIARCGVMEDFGDRNEAVLEMWQRVKGSVVSLWIILGIVVVIAGGVVIYILSNKSKKVRNKRLSKRA